MAAALVTYMPFVAAQFYPRASTLIPAGVAVGVGGAVLWCAKATYITVVADAFSPSRTSQTKSNVVVRFFGIFFFFFQTAQVWGNLISSSGRPWKRTKTNSHHVLISHNLQFSPGRRRRRLSRMRRIPQLL